MITKALIREACSYGLCEYRQTVTRCVEASSAQEAVQFLTLATNLPSYVTSCQGDVICLGTLPTTASRARGASNPMCHEVREVSLAWASNKVLAKRAI